MGHSQICVIKKRRDFVLTAQARSGASRVVAPGFILQIRDRRDGRDARIGYTCSKKVGNAVQRNRAKRRLREVARSILPRYGLPGYDYVLIGRAHVTASHDFAQMCSDFKQALLRTRS